MSPVVIPDRLQDLMAARPDLQAATLAFVSAAGRILDDNQMPFFPAYTDHGFAHVQRVLEGAVKLIPPAVWEQRLLEAPDAAVLTCATVLHDLALHVREPGFTQLVSHETAFRPLPWFDEAQAERTADMRWPALWESYRKEARQLTKSQLDRVLGPGNAGVPAIAFGEPERWEAWTAADRQLIGEFLRRHHARLAHEIAIQGFPGARDEDFPPLHAQLPQLADAIGVVARSHNEQLRAMLAYLRYRHPGNRRPAGAVLPYLMGLLRIADYFELDGRRAPTLLLHLREPQSPPSVAEWRKHQAITGVSWDHDDPEAIYVDVLPSHGLHTHLQLAELLQDLQRELDVTTAVLSETYGTTDLSPLQLAKRRVHTNLHEPSLHAQLPFLPRRATLRSAEDLFRLIVYDLYGDEPSVAGRELVQNAVDAVRARRRWEELGGEIDASDFRTQAQDVLVELREHDGRCLLRVADRGIGMTPDTVVRQFLTAGASLGPSQPADDELDPATAIRWMKAGRFGIGAFAAFLLGSEVHVKTRHVEAERGIAFVASLDGELVQLDWAEEELPFGTEIVVPFGRERVASISKLMLQIRGWYALAEPAVEFAVWHGGRRTLHRRSEGHVTTWDPLPARWRRIVPDGFDAVLWTPHMQPPATLSHNGIVVDEPGPTADAPFRNRAPYEWSRPMRLLRVPSLAVLDSRHRLGLTLNRYRLAARTLPFERELLTAIGEDCVAHALAVGPGRYPLAASHGFNPAFTMTSWIPLYPGLLERHCGTELCVLWSNHSTHREELERCFVGVRDARAYGWDAFPLRSVVGPPAHARATVLGSEPTSDLLGLEREILQLDALGWDVTASLLLLPAAFDRSSAIGLLPRWRRTTCEFAGSRYVAYTLAQGGDVERLEAFARRLLLDARGANVVALTLARATARGARQRDPLTDAWESLLGGALERNALELANRAAAVAATRPQLREAIERWRSR